MFKNIELTKNQYWAIIILAFGLLVFNGWLVTKLFNDEVPNQCPLPKDEVDRCDCVYNALGDKSLRYCFCYPGKYLDINSIKEVENGTE